MSINKSNNQNLEFDCFFISFRESNCEANWQRLLEFYPRAKRIHGVAGIHNAHLTCEKLSTTAWYWTVDGDNWLLSELHFQPTADLHMFSCRDPLYGDHTLLGGVKLWRTHAIQIRDMSHGDFCLNATQNKITHDWYFTESRYNDSAFDAWKTAFRHTAKLISPILKNRPHAKKLDWYLHRWESSQHSLAKNSLWCYRGHSDAKLFVLACESGLYDLSQINDYDFLEKYFHEQYHSISTDTQSF